MRRSGSVRATPATYIPFGKVEEVVIEHVDYKGNGKDIRYVERLKGVSLGWEKPSRPKRSDDHAEGCAGQRGVARLFWRGGKGYCSGCYELKFGLHPINDKLLEDPPARLARAESGTTDLGTIGH